MQSSEKYQEALVQVVHPGLLQTAAYSVVQCVTRYVALYYVALHCKRRRVANDKCRELTVQLFGRGALPPTATTTITTVHHNLTILHDSK